MLDITSNHGSRAARPRFSGYALESEPEEIEDDIAGLKASSRRELRRLLFGI
jgi:hypothetical protein